MDWNFLFGVRQLNRVCRRSRQLVESKSDENAIFSNFKLQSTPLRPRPKWWAAALIMLVRAAVLTPIKILWGLNVLYTSKKIILSCEIRVEYGYLSPMRGYLFGHVLHRIQCHNISPNYVYLIVNISIISLLQ